jgi:hypothetical protein
MFLALLLFFVFFDCEPIISLLWIAKLRFGPKALFLFFKLLTRNGVSMLGHGWRGVGYMSTQFSLVIGMSLALGKS